MMFKARLLFLLSALWRCEGSLLGGILSTAHEHIHSTVNDVAGAVLGGLNGLNLNFQGQIGANEQRRPGNGYGRPQGPHGNFGTNDVPYENNYGQGPHGYRPNQNGFQQPNNNNERPYAHNFNEYNRPFQNGHNNFNHPGNGNHKHPKNPNYDNNVQDFSNNDNYGFNNQGHPNNQNYNNGNNEHYYHNNQNHGYQNQNHDYHNNQYQNYPDNQNYPNNEYNNQNNIKKPNYENGPVNGNPYNEFISTQSQNNQNSPSTLSRPEFTTPTATYATENNNSKKDDLATQNQTDVDGPLFIPLGPNDYMYGGDKINVTAPKRQTDNKPQAAEEEDFPIDIRFKDE